MKKYKYNSRSNSSNSSSSNSSSSISIKRNNSECSLIDTDESLDITYSGSLDRYYTIKSEDVSKKTTNLSKSYPIQSRGEEYINKYNKNKKYITPKNNSNKKDLEEVDTNDSTEKDVEFIFNME